MLRRLLSPGPAVPGRVLRVPHAGPLPLPLPQARAYLNKADRKRILMSPKPAVGRDGSKDRDGSKAPVPPSGRAVEQGTPGETPPLPSSPAPSESLGKAHVLWYSDPYHLSDQVKSMMAAGRTAEAVELVERHKGAGNGAVYGTLLAQLKLHGEHDVVRQTYRTVWRPRCLRVADDSS
jgi:hypothetical protein